MIQCHRKGSKILKENFSKDSFQEYSSDVLELAYGTMAMAMGQEFEQAARNVYIKCSRNKLNEIKSI